MSTPRTEQGTPIRWLVLRIMLIGAVLVGLISLLIPREYRAALQTYQFTDDPLTIVVHASLGPGDTIVGSEVHEDDARIVVIVRARDTSSSAGMGESHFVAIHLKQPLGRRTVIDGTDLAGLAGHVVPLSP